MIPSFQNRFYNLSRLSIFCLLAAACFLQACSIPNLENPQCSAAQAAIKEFYSIHFDGELRPSAEKFTQTERYLSEGLIARLKSQPPASPEFDYFTQTADYPKAFRIGACEPVSPDTTLFEVLIFWKTETRSEQRDLKVEMIRENDKWLVNKVENKIN